MRLKLVFIRLALSLSLLVFFIDFLFFYLVLIQCKWPNGNFTSAENPIKVMLLADTHLLGPFKGHPVEKTRREWQMHRAFQTAVTLFRPELIFVLGDLFDEGKWVRQDYFDHYVDRYFRIFHTPPEVKLYSVVGNHDIGFHYVTHPYLVYRFDKAFNSTGVQMISHKGVHFVSINSVAMEQDGCSICEEAEREMIYISYQLKCARETKKNCKDVRKLDGPYSRPIVLQHYPMYRESDKECIETNIPMIEQYRERWEVISRESTDLIGELLEPRVAFSGHSHFYCRLINRRLKIEEFTVPSFNWRNINKPSIMLAKFTPTKYEVAKCDMPRETTIIAMYVCGIPLCFLFAFVQAGTLRRWFLRLRNRIVASRRKSSP